jgi:nucleotide-binding universal stress UspA family protein
MRILIALDSSPFADGLIEEISSRKWAEGTEFRLVSAVEATGSWDVDQEYISQVREILNNRVKTLTSKLAGQPKITGELLEGPSAAAILTEARNWKATLIMIGSHGDTGVRRDSLGSVAAAVVNESPCSVEVLKLSDKRLQLR